MKKIIVLALLMLGFASSNVQLLRADPPMAACPPVCGDGGGN